MAKRSPGRWWAGPAIGLAASLAVFPLLRSALFLGFELKTVDARMRWRGPLAASPEIAICAIDAKSVDRLGQWPWPRTVMAELIGHLSAAGARVIVLDAIFSEPAHCVAGEDEALARAVRDAGNVVLGYYLTSGPVGDHTGGASGSPGGSPAGGPAGEAEGTVPPPPVEQATVPPAGFPELPSYAGIETNIPALARASSRAGHFIVRPDADGTVRHYSLLLFHEGQLYPALALRAAQAFLGDPPITVRPIEGRLPLLRIGDLTIPASEKGELWVNFLAPYFSTFPYHSIVDVLSGGVPTSAFAGKMVFIGATEAGIGDTRTSPFDTSIPGLEVHATVADNILRHRFIMDGANESLLGMLAVLLLGPLCGAAAALVRRPLLGAAVAAAVLLSYTAGAQYAFSALARHLYLFVPLLAGALGFTAAAAWRNVFAEAKARQIRRTFQQFVSEAVVDEMLKDPSKVRLGGEKREMTVLFSDIRGFTSMSEKLAPEQVVSILNEYLTPMTRIIIERGGTLDKYMGDAIMAFFGAPVAQPDHPERACGAALAMKDGLAGLNMEWPRRGMPAIASGIGLNTGPMSVGNMGSTVVFDYTVIGDHVNLGSRLEGLTRVYGVDIIVSEHTEARARSGFAFREIDRVRVKGKEEAVRVFELFGRADEADEADDAPAAREFLETFAAGIAAYRRRQFELAEKLFSTALVLRFTDNPSALYLRRIESFRTAPPPDDWDGVTGLTEK